MNDKYLIRIAALVVCTYSIYMICHVIQGSLVPDGLILSGIVGLVAAIGGIKFGGLANKHEPGQE